MIYLLVNPTLMDNDFWMLEISPRSLSQAPVSVWLKEFFPDLTLSALRLYRERTTRMHFNKTERRFKDAFQSVRGRSLQFSKAI